MSIKFSTWAKAECSSCFQEFEVTRSEPKSFKNNSEIICSECKDYSRAYKDGFEEGHQQYKSIVKTVDPDNLPEGEVVAVLADHLHIVNFKIYEEAGISTSEITHYIETEDLINLFNGASK